MKTAARLELLLSNQPPLTIVTKQAEADDGEEREASSPKHTQSEMGLSTRLFPAIRQSYQKNRGKDRKC